MARFPIRRVLDRFQAGGARRADLSVAAYRTAFTVESDDE